MKVNSVMVSIFMSLILVLSLTGCSENDPKQLIRVTDSEPDIGVITSDKDMTDIKKMMDNVKWVEGTLKKPNREEDYKFWLEEEGVEERLANYEVWYEDNQTIIFNSTNGKVGELNKSDAQILKKYLINTSN